MRDLTYQKEAHISWKIPEGRAKLVILNLNTGNFFSLEDEVSIEIWHGLMAGKTLETVIGGLTAQYDSEDPSVVARDAEAFVGKLVENKIICACPKSGV